MTTTLSCPEMIEKDFPELVQAVKDAHKFMLIIGNEACKITTTKKSKKLSILCIMYADMVETIQASINLCFSGHYECTERLLRTIFEYTFAIKKFAEFKEESFDMSPEKVKLERDLLKLKDAPEDEKELKKYLYKTIDKLKKEIDAMKQSDREIFEYNLFIDVDSDPKIRIPIFMYIFSPTLLIRLFSEGGMKQIYLDTYDKLSRMSHPSFIGLMSRIETEGLRFSSNYNKKFAKPVLEDIFKIIIMANNSIREIFKSIKLTEEEGALYEKCNKNYEKLIPE